jgi:hypothetical protein
LARGEEVAVPMPTGGMDEPERIRPAIVDDIVWMLEHGSGDVDVVALVLQLFDASETEFDLAFAVAGERACLPVDEHVEALQAKIAGSCSVRCQMTRASSTTVRGTDVDP